MSVYDTSPIGSQTLGSGFHVVYGCNTNWHAGTVYRRLDVPSSTAASSPGTSATPASSTSIPSPTSTGTEGDAATSAPAPSRAWIAGAVVGPTVGCALVGLLVWWIMRQRTKKAAASSTTPPDHAWQAQQQKPIPPQELSNTPVNADHGGVFYEMPHENR
ncbi:hypothetical protein PG984_006587 [Apiospora sp. TS-2023a]